MTRPSLSSVTRWLGLLGLSVIITILHLLAYFSIWGERVEPWSSDLWFNLRGAVKPPSDIVMVAMDELSYTNLEIPFNSAWPRALHAKLLNRLADLGARRVVFDVLFLGPSDPKSDKALADAMKRVPTVIGADFGWREHGTGGGTFKVEELILPHEQFVKNVESLALVAMPEDSGYLRRFTTARSQLAAEIPTLAEAGAGKKPTDDGLPSARDLVWYYGPAMTIPTYSYYQLLETEQPLQGSLFKDKIVFVGLALRTEVGPAQKDSYLTPFFTRGRVFGCEIEATAAANLLTNQWVRRGSHWSEALLLGALTLVLTQAIFLLKPQWGGLILVLFNVGWAITAYHLFLSGTFLPGLLLCGIVLPISYLGSTLAYYFLTQRVQRRVERAFQLYLSPDMAREMRKNPDALKLGGENVYATALFTDIEGFTTLSESMLAAQVSEMLNAYFASVSGVVLANQGTLIKYIGDAVFALWGAPLKIPDHARRATQTAVQIQRAVETFNASGKFPPLHTRVGVHTGPMVVGNLGSAQRFDYTALGNSVNLAARLEGLNKYFGTTILISADTKRELGAGFNAISLGSVAVAGKKEAVEVFTLWDPSPSAETESSWAQALIHFRSRRWAEARSTMASVESREPRLAKVVAVYLETIQQYESSPPLDSWQGELSFLTK